MTHSTTHAAPAHHPLLPTTEDFNCSGVGQTTQRDRCRTQKAKEEIVSVRRKGIVQNSKKTPCCTKKASTQLGQRLPIRSEVLQSTRNPGHRDQMTKEETEANEQTPIKQRISEINS